jgi:hypothetical protein
MLRGRGAPRHPLDVEGIEGPRVLADKGTRPVAAFEEYADQHPADLARTTCCRDDHAVTTVEAPA